MAATEWQRIEELFHASSNLERRERESYLNRECDGDDQLRREVESLLETLDSANGFIEQPMMSMGMEVLSFQGRKLRSGEFVGHYKILRTLGVGGMGEVYLAEDCTLERQVALKFLAGGFRDNHWAKTQLMKEARAIARLENPNICAVHGIEEVGEDNFIVMQFIEGETLADLLEHGRTSDDRALDFAEQIVSALAAAHLRGIIHRDIKPQNIIVTPEGQIKVLDFGIAKLVQQKWPVGTIDLSRTATGQLGFALGTAAYMSPEQTAGQELDHRSDIFSFGIVLYEMLSGRNPFHRSDIEETMAAINEEQPPPLPRTVPRELVRICFQCLEKDRTQRFANTDDLLHAIQQLRGTRRPQGLIATLQVLRHHPHFPRYAFAAVAFVVCLLSAAGFIYSRVTKVHTLAMLPITNKTGDSSLDYLSEGLTQSLYDKFSYLPRLNTRLLTEVPAPNAQDVVRTGRELKVESVFAGEILRQGDSRVLRLSVVNTADGATRLEKTVNLDGVKMFDVQENITRDVAQALGLWLIGDEKKLLAKRQTDNEEALRFYMRGRVHWSLKRDKENLRLAISSFEQAVALDPAFAQAYTGLADCYVLQAGNVVYGPRVTKEAIVKARYNAQKALEIDPSLPEAHTSMGVVKLKFDWDWHHAEQEFKFAKTLNREYAPAYYWYSNLLAVLGRFDESISEAARARELDPYSPLAEMNYGRALYYAGRYDDAATYFDTLLQQRPEYAQFVHVKAYVQIQRGQLDDAIAMLERLHASRPLHAAAALGYAYGKAGRNADALKIAAELEQFSRQESISPHEQALVYVGMGKLDKAFEFLEAAYQERFPGLAFLGTDPLYDGLRSDSRFQNLCNRVGQLKINPPRAANEQAARP